MQITIRIALGAFLQLAGYRGGGLLGAVAAPEVAQALSLRPDVNSHWAHR